MRDSNELLANFPQFDEIIKALNILNDQALNRTEYLTIDNLFDNPEQAAKSCGLKFRKLAKNKHPDKIGDDDGSRMKELVGANELIKKITKELTSYTWPRRQEIKQNMVQTDPGERYYNRNLPKNTEFTQQLEAFRDNLSKDTDAAAKVLNNYFSDSLICEHVRRLFLIGAFKFEELMQFYNSQLKKPESQEETDQQCKQRLSRLEVFLLLRDDDLIGRRINQFVPQRREYARTFVDELNEFFSDPQFSDVYATENIDITEENGKPRFKQRNDFSVFEKACAFFWYDKDNEYKGSLQYYLPSDLAFLNLTRLKLEFLHESFLSQKEYCTNNKKIAVLSNKPKPWVGPRYRYDEIRGMFHQDMEEFYKFVQQYLLDQVEGKKQKHQEEINQREAFLRKKYPTITDQMLQQDEAVVLLNKKITVADAAKQAVIKEIQDTHRDALHQDPSSNLHDPHAWRLRRGGLDKTNHYKREEHVFYRVIRVMQRYANDEERLEQREQKQEKVVTKSRNPNMDSLRAIIGGFLIVCQAALLWTPFLNTHYRREYFHTFFHTGTQANMLRAVETFGDQVESTLVPL